uniref:Hematopoietic lineage cell-specific protein n=1 Tax=Pelodiscus sinensis TaxID=13735 RepID=K7G8Y3_PELSI|nr:hematopoietic lineage cell-specific protein [Pelodiscus sinensis]|eukprot:XP_006120803.1 hematopoietic lineage cell-specific protein [Pelodiscus sinensis]
MWKAAVGHNVAVKVESQGDDWDTDPDFVNDISEKDQRWGAKTIEGSGRAEHINIHQLRSKVSEEHEVIKQKELASGPKASYGYGGKFGKEKDRMDKSALGHEYVADVEKHSSQTDAAKGFGGKYGVQRDRADKSALGFEYKGEVEKHSSQKDYSKGFGGRYGVEKDKLDKAAVGFEYKGQTEKHESQKDYAVGFGGKFGVQKDRQDKCALGWEHQEELNRHESQTDYAKGFGGRYGVQEDRVDESAVGFSEMEAPTSSYEKTKPVEAASSGARSLKSRFEGLAKSADEEARKRVEEERMRRQAREQRERQAAREQQEPQKSEETSHKEPVPTPAVVPRKISKAPAVLPNRQGQQKEQEPQDEDQAPALPPRPSDLGEDASELREESPGAQAIYADSVELQGDYEELPEPASYEDGADVGGDYEELPEPSSKYDEGEDAGEDYEEIPPESTPSSSRSIPCPGESGNVYEADEAGLSAVALYDYQGEGDDEISFDPNDTITNIEMVDEGWWRGHCHGRAGLFPANYVKLLQ